MVFIFKYQKPSAHCGCVMTASLQHISGVFREKSDFPAGRVTWHWDWSNWGVTSSWWWATPPKFSKASTVNFLAWVDKSFATQTWALGLVSLPPLHHSQSCVLFPGKREIFLGSQAKAFQHTLLPQPPQGYHQGGFLYNSSHWIRTSRNPVRANSFNWYVYSMAMMAVRQK